MSDQRPGLDYREASKRVKRIMSNSGHPQAKQNLVKSIINQATVREGERAQESLIKLAKESSSLSGRGTKQTGYGPGVRMGAGRWRYIDGTWEKVE